MINVVSFPGLGWEFELNRVAFTLFGKDIYWYGVIIAVGFLLAVSFCLRFMAHRFGADADKIMDLLFIAVPAAIIGARAYYVIFNVDQYINREGKFLWGDAIAIWDGGLAIYGGLIAAILSAVIYCKVRRQPFWCYTDTASYGFLIGQLVGRWGNFVNVEAFGGVTDVAWRMSSPAIADYLYYQTDYIDPDVYHKILDGTLGVHPTFFYESVWNLIGFFVLLLIAKKWRKFDGQIFLSYVVWYGVGRTIIEGLRTDSLYFFGTGLRTSQLVGIISAAAALIFMIIRFRSAPPATAPIPRTVKGKANAEKEEEEQE